VKVVAEQAVDQNGLTFEIVPESCSAKATVVDGAGLRELVDQLEATDVVEVALTADHIHGAAVLTLNLGHEVGGALDGHVRVVVVDEVDQD